MRYLIIRLVSIVSILSVLFTTHVAADEVDFIKQSIRARGMGGAFTAVANDEMVLFYNPAGLASLTHNMYELFHIGGVTNENLAELIQAVADTNGMTEDEQSSAILSKIGELPGKAAYLEVNLGGVSILTPSWGYSLFSGFLLDLEINNPSVPFFRTRAYGQGGIIAGYATSFFDRKLDLGIGVKTVMRTGINDTIRISDQSITDAINHAGSGEQQQAVDQLTNRAGSVGRIAPDLGMTYHIDSIGNLHTKWSVVAQNIGDMNFDNAGNVPMTFTTGLSTESEFSGFDLTLAADFFDLTSQRTAKASFMRRLKLGAELGFNKLYNGHHLFALRVGQNGVYPTMGISFNLFGVVFDYAQWSEEVGEVAGDKEDKRAAIQISLIF